MLILLRFGRGHPSDSYLMCVGFPRRFRVEGLYCGRSMGADILISWLNFRVV